MSRAFPSCLRSLLTEIYLCHACSCHEIEDGHARTGLRAVRVAAGQAVVREGEAGDAFYVVLRGAHRRRGWQRGAHSSHGGGDRHSVRPSWMGHLKPEKLSEPDTRQRQQSPAGNGFQLAHSSRSESINQPGREDWVTVGVACMAGHVGVTIKGEVPGDGSWDGVMREGVGFGELALTNSGDVRSIQRRCIPALCRVVTRTPP
eukprot:COSAG01_NODE_3434_length_6100_cov_7.180970_3_plen_203_part_00